MRPVARVFFPLDEQLELWEPHWSASVVKYAVWLSGLVPFAEASTILNTIGEIPISASSIWRRVTVWGPHCQALEALQRAASAAAPTQEELKQAVPLEGQNLGVAMDGGMVQIREEGWNELKVGGVFALRQQPTRDKHTGEIVELAHAVATPMWPTWVGRVSLVTWYGRKRANGMGCKPATRSCSAMGPPGSGIWPPISASPVAKAWIGIMPNCIGPQPPVPYLAKAQRRRGVGCVTRKRR